VDSSSRGLILAELKAWSGYLAGTEGKLVSRQAHSYCAMAFRLAILGPGLTSAGRNKHIQLEERKIASSDIIGNA
jgi:hypothetical protein